MKWEVEFQKNLIKALFDPNQPRDEKGRWTSGSMTGYLPTKKKSPPDAELGAIKLKAGHKSVEDWYNRFHEEVGNPEKKSKGHSEIAQAISAGQTGDVVILADFKGGKGISGAVSFDFDEGDLTISHLGSTGQIKGTGTELIRHVVDRASKRNRGIKFESTKSAEGFYRNLGFAHKDEKQSKLMGMSAEAVKKLRKVLGSPGRFKK